MKFGKSFGTIFVSMILGMTTVLGACGGGGKDDSSVDSSSSAEQPLDKVTATKVVTYDGPSILESSDKVDISVEGKDLFVYESRVNHKRMNDWAVPATTAPVAVFDFEGKVKVEVTIKGISSVSSAVVRPLSYGVEPTIDGNKISFTLTQPVPYVVEYDGKTEEAIHIFANTPETDEEKIDPENVPENTVYIGPGVYKADAIPVTKDNVTVYIAGGAVVYGNIRAEQVKNLTIRGRGIIDGFIYPRTKDSEYTLPIELKNCKDVEISDLTFLDPAGWVMTLYHCENVKVNDVKMITARSNGDGISVQSCKDVDVKGGFIRGWDDALVVKNKDRGVTENVSFDGVTIWTDLAQSMEVGYETDGEYIRDITFENITVLHNFHKPVISIHNADDAKINGVTFRNITVEDAQMQADTPADVSDDLLIDFSIAYSPVWSVTDARGTIENVTVDNVLVLNQKQGISSKMAGYSESNMIKNVTFNNIKLVDKEVRSAEDLFMNSNSNVNGVKYSYSGAGATGAKLYERYELALADGDTAEVSAVEGIEQEGVLVPSFSKIEQQEIFNGVKATGDFTVSATHGKGTKTTASPDDGSGDWSAAGAGAEKLLDGDLDSAWIGKSGMKEEDEFIALTIKFDEPKTIGSVRIHTEGQYAQKYHMVAYNVTEKADGTDAYRLIGTYDFDLSPATGNYADIKIASKEYTGLQFRLFNTQGLLYPKTMKLTEIEFYPTSLTFQKAVYASEYEDVYVAGNAVDGNASSYFETKKGMWPAYIAVDMGAVYDIKYINIHLPPLMTWEPRTQNIEIQISTDAWSSGMTIDQIHFTTLIEGKGYTFDPATGNVVALVLDTPVPARFVKLVYRSNSSLGGYGAQISELSVFGA